MADFRLGNRPPDDDNFGRAAVPPRVNKFITIFFQKYYMICMCTRLHYNLKRVLRDNNVKKKLGLVEFELCG